MLRILITGTSSYIGKAIYSRLIRFPESYQIDTVGVKNGEWEKVDFSKYDTVVHVAGLAHIKETKNNRSDFYRVNKEVTVNIATRAKNSKVKHFIYLSSMSVYGKDDGIINKDTPLVPNSAYGKSKLEAEYQLRKIEDTFFKVAILRPPMVYGKNCVGNYQTLSKFSKKTIIFLDSNNMRSMIFIENLAEFVKLVMDKKDSGIFHPQNKEFVSTANLVKSISEIHGRKVYFLRLNSHILNIIKKRNRYFNKVFGDLVYDKELSYYADDYTLKDFKSSISATEID